MCHVSFTCERIINRAAQFCTHRKTLVVLAGISYKATLTQSRCDVTNDFYTFFLQSTMSMYLHI